MATVSFSHRLDLSAVRTLLTSPQGGVIRDLLRRGLLVETQAKRNLGGIGGPKRIDTGRLRASIATQVVRRNGDPAVLVGTNVNYALAVHDGTGIYGPKGRPIKPRHGKFLRFKAKPGGKSQPPGKKPKKKGSGGYVYARSAKGMQRNQFLKNALTAARG
jgi:hypothetical protein